MTRHLQKMVEHSGWANARTLDALREADSPEGIRLLSHILMAERLYFQRCEGLDPWPQDFWPELSVEECEEMIEANRRSLASFLKNHSAADLEERVGYRTSEGAFYETPIEDLLLQVFLHGQHHRGQIARLVREAGGEPPVIDYIAFVREQG